jgi:hypothetical protein
MVPCLSTSKKDMINNIRMKERHTQRDTERHRERKRKKERKKERKCQNGPLPKDSRIIGKILRTL